MAGRTLQTIHDRGEQQGAGVLPLGELLEQGVDGAGVQGVFQGGTGHDGDRALRCEPLEDVVEDHVAASVECHYLLVWRHFSRRITPTSKPWGEGPNVGAFVALGVEVEGVELADPVHHPSVMVGHQVGVLVLSMDRVARVITA
jgi:hypothetical protein